MILIHWQHFLISGDSISCKQWQQCYRNTTFDDDHGITTMIIITMMLLKISVFPSIGYVHAMSINKPPCSGYACRLGIVGLMGSQSMGPCQEPLSMVTPAWTLMSTARAMWPGTSPPCLCRCSQPDCTWNGNTQEPTAHISVYCQVATAHAHMHSDRLT